MRQVRLAIEQDRARRTRLRVVVKAEVFGGWCVHEAYPGEPEHGYRVSHVATGRRLFEGVDTTRGRARRIAQLLRDRMAGFEPDPLTGVPNGDGWTWRGIAEAAFAEVLAS